MTSIVCDICRKLVPDARKDVNYVAVLDKDICVACQEDLLNATKKQMLTRRPYLFKDYQETLTKTLAKMTGR
jgi:hypothetical protein